MTLGKLGKTSLPTAEVLAAMSNLRSGDARWKEGKTWSLVYYAGEEISGPHPRGLHALHGRERALAPGLPQPPALRSRGVLHRGQPLRQPGRRGHHDLGRHREPADGGEDRARLRPGHPRDHRAGDGPPQAAHPALDKAAHYFGVKAIRTPVGADYRADVRAMTERIGPNTVMLVASAPAYPHGVIGSDCGDRRDGAHPRVALPRRCLPGWVPAALRPPAPHGTSAVRLLGTWRDLDLRRPSQVRLRREGRLGDPRTRPPSSAGTSSSPPASGRAVCMPRRR